MMVVVVMVEVVLVLGIVLYYMIGRTHTMVVIGIVVVVVLVLGFVLHIYLGSFDPMMVVVFYG
jgi:hypothetical protein